MNELPFAIISIIMAIDLLYEHKMENSLTFCNTFFYFAQNQIFPFFGVKIEKLYV